MTLNYLWMKITPDRFTLYSLACTFLPCLIYQLILAVRNRRSGRKTSFSHYIWIYIFLIYLWMVFQVTGIGTIGDVLREDTEWIMGGFNIVPFDSFGMGYILNIIMCVPFGFLLPFIWKQCRSLGKTVLFGGMFSLTIELTQLFNWRATDIDDLTANICGALIGYLIWKGFSKICGEHLKTGEEERGEALMYVLLSLLGVFFLYNPYLLL